MVEIVLILIYKRIKKGVPSDPHKNWEILIDEVVCLKQVPKCYDEWNMLVSTVVPGTISHLEYIWIYE